MKSEMIYAQTVRRFACSTHPVIPSEARNLLFDAAPSTPQLLQISESRFHLFPFNFQLSTFDFPRRTF